MKKRLSSLLLSAALLLLAVPAGAADVSWSDMQLGRTKSVQTLGGVVHTMMVLQEDGTLWGWGNTTEGELGNGGRYDRISQCGGSAFYQVDEPELLMSDVAFVDLGVITTAVQRDGSLWYSGAPLQAQAWDEIEHQQEFTKLADGIVSAASFEYWNHTYFHPFDVPILLALDEDGTLWSYRWEVDQVVPPDMPGDQKGLYHFDRGSCQKVMDGVAKVVAGIDHALCLTALGEVYAWGDWYNGQLGDGRVGDSAMMWDVIWDPDLTFEDRPVKVLSNAVDLFAGPYCSGAVLGNGDCLAWGRNIGMMERSSATPVLIAEGVRSADYSSGVVALVMQDSTLWCMGNVSSVFRDLPDSDTPVFTGIDHVVQAASNGRSVSYVLEDGSLWAAGKLYGSAFGFEWNDYEFMVQDGRAYSDGIQITGLGVEPPQFSDVSATDYFADPVAWAVENGVTAGTGESTFGPDDTCTTAQIITFLWRAYGSPAPAGGSSFPDVPAGAWYADAAAWAQDEGLISGALFHGDTPATRAATMTYLWKLADRPEAGTVPFSDVPAGADYAQAVSWAVSEGITAGTGEDTFGPDEICTRAQIVTFLYNALAN